MSEEKHKELMAFLAGSGFIWGPEPEIYGGLGGFYTYAPLGKLLKNNVENAIRAVFKKNDFWEVECPIVSPAKVWEASGHLGGFTDPLIKCTKCGADHRVDKLIEEQSEELHVGGMNEKELLDVIEANSIVCSLCDGKLEKKITKHSLMMGTIVGTDTVAYNRGETATTTYLPFKRFDDFFRKKYPFGVFQIGKAFRNEISPRQSVMRGREFTQAEGQLFIHPKQKENFLKFDEVKSKELPLWNESLQKLGQAPQKTKLSDAVAKKLLGSQAYAWTLNLAYDLFLSMGIPKEKIRFRQHHKDEKAFYAKDAWDIEVLTNSFGWYEMCGVHDRGDYDLTQHSKFSGVKLEAFSEEFKEKFVPHILEIAFGADRPAYALLDIFYDTSDKERKVLRMPAHLAPVQAGVYPLVKKEGLPEIAKEIHSMISKYLVAVYDESGSIGRRYARHDEEGIPFGITVDFDTLKDDTVTLRDRDTQKQIRVKKEDLGKIFQDLMLMNKKFEDLKQ